MRFILFLFASIATHVIHAQSTGIGTASPHASAILDVSSTSKGLLVPRVSLIAANSTSPVTAPQISLLVYNTATAGAGTNAITPGYYYWNGTTWTRLVGTADIATSAWSLRGNAGTDTAINFIGTTDAASLLFKVNGKKIGLLEDTSGSSNGNIAWGMGALTQNQIGFWNIAIGKNALKANLDGYENIAIGNESLSANQFGYFNVGLGAGTLNKNTGGWGNTAIGYGALARNIGGAFNLSLGYNAMRFNTNGEYNIALGFRAMENNMLGVRNIAIGESALGGNGNPKNSIAIGDSALYNNSSQNAQNIALGASALHSNTTGLGNIAIGNGALRSNQVNIGSLAIGDSSGYASTSFANTFIGYRSGRNTIGGYRNTFVGIETGFRNITGADNVFLGTSAGRNNLGYQNTYIGSGSGFSNNNGVNNTFIGSNSGGANSDGQSNTFIGSITGSSNTIGSFNVIVGQYAGGANGSGHFNTIIGASANLGSDNLSNAIAIGYKAFVTQNNSLILGSIKGVNGAIDNTKVGIGTTAPKAKLHVADSSVVFTALSPLTLTPGVVPVSGAGSRMMWYADKAAFRVGNVSETLDYEDGSTYWDTENIGEYSFASGRNTMAKGALSTAMGFQTFAENFSTSIGFVSKATGGWSTAIGSFARAEANYATVIGRGTASGYGSFATGFDTWALADHSSALGFRTRASGIYATATGDSTVARAFASMSIGRNNDSIFTSSTNTWVPTDPLLYIGNGTNNNNRSNAMVVYKNGNTDVNGFTQLGKVTEAAPKIKMKKLIGTSAAAQNNWVNIVHGLTQSKIISVNIIMTVPAFVNVPPSYTYTTGYEYHYQVSATHIVVINSATNSANILSKFFTILVTYEE